MAEQNTIAAKLLNLWSKTTSNPGIPVSLILWTENAKVFAQDDAYTKQVHILLLHRIFHLAVSG
jgi:hypothetical protein